MPRRIAGVLVIALALIGFANQHGAAQNTGHWTSFRLGEGISLTSPGIRSIVVSWDGFRFSDDDERITLYLDENVMFGHRSDRLDFIAGVAPMLRAALWRNTPTLTIEAGCGLSYVSRTIMDGRYLGSHLLFSPTISAGFEVPWSDGLLGIHYTFRHLSNGGFFVENDGINFQFIVLSMRVRNF